MPVSRTKTGKVPTSGESIAPEERPRVETVEEAPTPRVSAIIVSYNNAEGLRQCVHSLEASTIRSRLEILVIDKGSRDESPQLDTEFPDITILRLPRNFGTTKALNIAMRTAAADLVFFLAPEVTVEPTTVARLADRLEASEDVVAVCPVLSHDEQFFRLPDPGSGATLAPVHIADTGTLAGDGSGEGVEVEGATFDAMMARKYFVRGLNYLDEKYGEFWSDVELAYQIRRAGKKMIVLPSARASYERPVDKYPPGAANLLESDKISGAARYFGKHFGFFSALMFRLKAMFGALFTGRFGLFIGVLSGKKVDGTQSEM